MLKRLLPHFPQRRGTTNAVVVSRVPGPQGEVDAELLKGFVRTAMWRGWRGGFLVAQPGLSKWFWVSEPVADQHRLAVVDLDLLREADDLKSCTYLAGVLGSPLSSVGWAMGIRHIYGPHHNEVDVCLRRAEKWGTTQLDTVLAEQCLREHLRRVSADPHAPLPRLVWARPSEQASGQIDGDLSAAYRLCLARRTAQVRAWGAGLQIGMILADATKSARGAVGRRTGTAWLWEPPISSFTHDAAWVGIGGDWSLGATGNPFSPTRALYAMGVSFYLARSVVYLYAASD